MTKWSAFVVALSLAAQTGSSTADRLWQHRNLGKAFYENPTTQIQAVDEFKKALDLTPDSARERLNYGLSLLRAGKTKEGVAEIEKAQKQDPKIPHTWFNLGIVFKKESEYEKATAQLEQMIKLVPDEPISHYNLAVLYKLAGKQDEALKHFETASRLDPNLAGPHFQLYNAYRTLQRTADAQRELQTFQEIKKRTAGAAIPEDMEWSFYSEIYETIEPKPAVPHTPLKFTGTTLSGKVDPSSAGIVSLDLAGSGKGDALVWSSTGVHAGEKIGLGGLKGVRAVVPGDFDNDGLSDLAVLTDTGASLYSNKKGTFAKSAVNLPAGNFTSAVWIDYDHDYDIDLVLLGEKSVLARNNGAAGFSEQPFPFVPGKPAAGTVFEYIADTTNTDLAVVYKDREAVLYRDKLAGKYEAVPIKIPAADTILTYDFNKDGHMDLIAASRSSITMAMNEEGKGFAIATVTGSGGPLAVADLENRGDPDLILAGAIHRKVTASDIEKPLPAAVALATLERDVVLVAADGTVQYFKNETPTKHNWTRVALTGVKNLKLAPGSEVEVKAGQLYQKLIYNGVPLLFGLGPYQAMETIRITWPNGLIQNETKQAINKPLAFKEAQRLSGSCPMIFTWNGKEFEFITDVLGVAPLGASAGDGTYFPVDHDEYIQIPGSKLKAVDGQYEIRITEELREVSYLDQIKLIAVDHPASVDIFTNDKFKAPPFPEFRLYGATDRIHPIRARDAQGRDIRERLARTDRVYPDGFRRDYSGVAEKHHLDLDFGPGANKGILVLSGWVDWADGSTFLGASQESKEGLIFPYIQVKDARGQWKTVIEDMGIPAGKPKTIAVDLTGKFLSASREVRIVTNLCVYWDEIFLDENTAAPPATLTALLPASADLRFRGFSRPEIHRERKQPESFHYHQWMPASMWNPTPGLYTRFGDAKPLLNAIDDKLVIMGSGDELILKFKADLPALKPGHIRDFLLFVDGWAKDGDANTAYSQTVEPLPFHGMSQYPYPPSERFPESAEMKEYTTRPALRLIRPMSLNRR